MTKEKVTLSKSARLITWIVIPILIVFGLLIPLRDFMHSPSTGMQALFGCVILIILLSLVSILVYAPKEIALDDTCLTLTKGAGTLRIPYSDMEEVRMYNPRNTGNIRVFGIGGVCGYIGRFYNRDIGYYTSYVGDYEQAFFIRTRKGKKYLLSCEHAEKIAEKLKARIAG